MSVFRLVATGEDEDEDEDEVEVELSRRLVTLAGSGPSMPMR